MINALPVVVERSKEDEDIAQVAKSINGYLNPDSRIQYGRLNWLNEKLHIHDVNIL